MNTLTSAALDPRPATIAPYLLDTFEQQIQHEWMQGSGVAPDLFAAGVSIVPDLELAAGGEVLGTPIHDALGWQYRRFGYKAHSSQYAALLFTLNPEHEGEREVFQAKLSQPIFDRKKGKHRKYESPKGFGVRGGFAPVTNRVWRDIARRHGLTLDCPIDPQHPEHNPKRYDFWQWVEDRPAVNITLTEGMKKAQHLLSQNRCCIALSGITMGVFNPDGDGKRLRPYLQRFAHKDRKIFIAFDAESKPKTLRDVSRETRKLGRCFLDAGCTVRVIRIPLLPETDKTGIDDYGVACGEFAVELLYTEALPYSAWLWHRQYSALRTREPSLTLEQPELQLAPEDFPERGIVALESAKGTGKTNCIQSLVADSPKVLLLTHRVCLGRNLAARLDTTWKADADRGNGTWIANGDSPTERIGLCVDSLLSIDPSEFRDCELVLDEVDQVVSHLLASSTCNKDGRRPALLARFHDLIRVAKRVTIASADVTDSELRYCERLRNDAQPAFLIRNTFVPQGYPVQILDAPNKSALIARLLAAVEAGQRIFVATDAKSDSKAIAQLIDEVSESAPSRKVLLINSDTSGGEIEVEFIRNLNQAVLDYDIVIATPSLATGVSIEVEHFDLVFGLFNGVLSDSDIAQALARVRAPIPRIVWCAHHGKNFSKASKSEYPLIVRKDLLTRWDKEICLIRSSLRPDIGAVVEQEFSFKDNPHLEQWSHIVARTNGAMWALREGLIQRLQFEGNQVEIVVVTEEDDGDLREQIKQARHKTKQADFAAIAERGRVLNSEELRQLQQQEKRTPQQLLDERKTQLAKFYVLSDEEIAPALVELDDGARLRGKVVELESLIYGKEFAVHRDSRTIERQAYWEKGLFLPDQSCLELRRQIRELLELETYLDPTQEWSSDDLAELCDKARQNALALSSCLGYRVSEKTSNGQIFRALLGQLGIKCKTRHVGPRGHQVKLYQIDGEHWELMTQILERREEERQRARALEQPVLTPLINLSIQDRVDTMRDRLPALPRIGDWVSWEKFPDLQWVLDKIDGSIGVLRGITGALTRQVPLDEISVASTV